MQGEVAIVAFSRGHGALAPMKRTTVSQGDVHGRCHGVARRVMAWFARSAATMKDSMGSWQLRRGGL